MVSNNHHVAGKGMCVGFGANGALDHFWIIYAVGRGRSRVVPYLWPGI
jgi:hypothetical protein